MAFCQGGLFLGKPIASLVKFLPRSQNFLELTDLLLQLGDVGLATSGVTT
jgi:hypothetical protein